MKNYFILLVIIFIVNISFAQITATPKSPEESDKKTNYVVEENIQLKNDSSYYFHTSNDSILVYSLVESMPAWYDCNQVNEAQRMSCTYNKIQAYLARNIKYPSKPKKKGIGGTVYVTFIIDEVGNVIETKILKGAHEDLNQESLRVVMQMPQWIPGTHKGEHVKVQYNLPIRYTLR